MYERDEFMRKKCNKKLWSTLLIGTLIFSLWGISFPVKAETNEGTKTLNVALYGYVPDIERFEKAVSTKWSELESNITLNFVDWDCYESDPTEDVDVFVFDALYFQSYVEQGYLLEIPSEDIAEREDILPFALDGCTLGGNVYAIPQIICTNLLYYRNGDTEVENANTIDELFNVIGKRQSQTVIPNNNEGLLIDMSSGISKTCFYLDGLIDHNQIYNSYSDLPPANEFNEEVINRLKTLQSMAGKEQSQYVPDNNDSYIRAKWFEQGSGRAYMGYTEAMSNMGSFVNDIDFKNISYCKEDNIPLFFGDLVGINSKISDSKKDLAYKLANTITATETMDMAISSDDSKPYPQYLLPARRSVYMDMGKLYPIYNELYNIVNNSANKLFLLGPGAKDWLEETNSNIGNLLK